MRIRFGLILKITERTKSYKPPKQHYFIKTPEIQAKLPIFSGSHPNYSPQLFQNRFHGFARLYHRPGACSAILQILVGGGGRDYRVT